MKKYILVTATANCERKRANIYPTAIAGSEVYLNNNEWDNIFCDSKVLAKESEHMK